jgi:hypothetical protein
VAANDLLERSFVARRDEATQQLCVAPALDVAVAALEPGIAHAVHFHYKDNADKGVNLFRILAKSNKWPDRRKHAAAATTVPVRRVPFSKLVHAIRKGTTACGPLIER